MKRALLILAALAIAGSADARRRSSTQTDDAEKLATKIKATKERPQKTLHLYINDGQWKLADGKETYIVSYVAYNEKFEEMPADGKLPPPQIPAPTLRVKVGDDVRVVLHNSGHHHLEKDSAFSNVPHTIHFHGMDLVQTYDGVPGVPTKGIPNALLAGVPVGESYTYHFVPQYEGTYMYHCHVDTSTHALLGMFGAFIVDGPKPSTIYGHHYDREYTLFFSEMDTDHNDAIHDVGDYDMMKFKPNYWLLNGRIFTADLANPLSTIADKRSVIAAKEGETVLIRMLAMGWEHVWAFHPHAYHMRVIGMDGRGLDSPYWKDTLPITSGERIDVLVPIKDKKDKVCMSCGLGKGLSIAHDHNLRGETSSGKYPRGPLTVFSVE